MRALRILLVDDNREFLDAAARFLITDPEMTVAGTAASGPEALAQATRLRPDLILMDITMPGMNGLEATRILKRTPDAPRVIFLSLLDTAEYRALAEAAGADGFLNKAQFGERLLPLIRTLFS